MRHTKPFDPVQLVLHLLFIVVALLTVLPFFMLIVLSLTDNNEILQKGYQLWPSKFSLEAYQTLLTNPTMVINAYTVTLITTIVGSFVHVMTCAMFAYPLTFKSLKGRNVVTFLMFFTMLFNGGLVATYIITTQWYGFRDSYLGLIAPLAFSAFNVLIFRTYFSTTFPKEIEESAKMDGATDLTIFFRMVLPLSTPVLATIGLFSALSYWNDWFQSLLYISKDEMFTLQFVMMKTMRQIEAMQRLIQMGATPDVIERLQKVPSETIQFAMVIIAIGPILLLYPFVQKYFVKGITLGSVKG